MVCGCPIFLFLLEWLEHGCSDITEIDSQGWNLELGRLTRNQYYYINIFQVFIFAAFSIFIGASISPGTSAIIINCVQQVVDSSAAHVQINSPIFGFP